MKTPIFVRPLSEKERESLEKGLRSKDAFAMRRSQVLLASAKGERAPKIASNLGCASQTVRDAIHDFNRRGLLALEAKSSRPRRTRDAFDEESAEKLRGMLHRSPREFGYQTSLWTLGMAAEAAFENGLTEERVSGETIRATLSRLLGVRWMRAKRWITSPDPLYERKKGGATDCWKWPPRTPAPGPSASRTNAGGAAWRFPHSTPGARRATLCASSSGRSQKMIKDDPEPKAISCYGLYLPEIADMWVRFVDGRPVSSITTQFLEWGLEKLEEMGKKVLLLIWDNASWHVSKEVRRWLGRHNRRVKESAEGVRIASCLLPKRSPWLNAIEPKWVHGKRKVVEPDGLLGAYELAERVCGAFGCPHHEHLTVPQKVA